jgi:hypothetical protein
MNIKEFFKKAKDIKLDKSEKKAVRDNLILFMRKNPAHFGVEVQKLNYSNRSSFHKPMAAAFAAALLIVGGVSVAAEGSLPGDVLYPVKVSINERVVDLAAVSEKADVRWETKVAERRLDEVKKLADQKPQEQGELPRGQGGGFDVMQNGTFIIDAQEQQNPAVISGPQIEAVDELIAKARENIASGSYKKARELSREAREAAKEAIKAHRKARVELKERF